MNILTCNCTDKWGGWSLLALRLVVGVIFLAHGWQKVGMGVDGVAGFLGSLGFPLPVFFAILLIIAEVVGGLFLILGLFTHWTSKILAIVSIVALVSVHLAKGFFISEGGFEFILLILVSSLVLMTMGGGKFALDDKLAKKAA